MSVQNVDNQSNRLAMFSLHFFQNSLSGVKKLYAEERLNMCCFPDLTSVATIFRRQSDNDL